VCGQYLGVIDYEEIAGLKKVWQLVDTAMCKRTIEPLQNEQPGVIAWKVRVGGNQRGIERKVEL
jgi:hypothetical protein